MLRGKCRSFYLGFSVKNKRAIELIITARSVFFYETLDILSWDDCGIAW